MFMFMTEKPGNPCGRERLCTVDLLVLSSLDQLIFKLRKSFTVVTKKGTLMRRSMVLSIPLQLVFPGNEFTLKLF